MTVPPGSTDSSSCQQCTVPAPFFARLRCCYTLPVTRLGTHTGGFAPCTPELGVDVSQIPLAAVPEMVYYIAGSHSHSESAKIWHEFRLTPENNRKELAHDYSERKDSTAGRPRVSQALIS